MDAEQPTASNTTGFKFESRRLSQTDRIVGGATLVLFVSLFLSWFGYHYGGVFVALSLSGLWHGYMYLTLLVCLALLAYFVGKAGYESLPVRLPIADAQLVVIGTAINAVLTVVSFLTKPSGWSWEIGAYIGLIAAIVAVAPRLVPALLARRSAARGTK
ncbi:MAG: hypothetical protein JWO62_331 [Acidimicrobiaceae bacterium]|jgi:hypothetical protein|nr:hypothetical protein [Acidimicrobiaceae bacterium]